MIKVSCSKRTQMPGLHHAADHFKKPGKELTDGCRHHCRRFKNMVKRQRFTLWTSPFPRGGIWALEAKRQGEQPCFVCFGLARQQKGTYLVCSYPTKDATKITCPSAA